jgi:DNA-binding transcriptional ArsR family regulator
MTTATVIKTKFVPKVTKTQFVPKVTKAQKDTALRFKQAQQAANLLKMVSDPTRLQIVLMLAEGERHVGALGETVNQSPPATSHHLALLRHGSIISPRRQGKNNFYALTEAGEQLARIVKGVVG